MRFISLSAVLVFAFASAQAGADEISDAMRAAQSAYESGDHLTARHQLDLASELLATEVAQKLTRLLPKALPGWEAEVSDAEEMEAGAGGLTATKQFRKGDQEITISITGESPMLSALRLMFSNPTMATTLGVKTKSIKGHQALVTEDEQIQLMVGDRFFVLAEGNASEADKTAYLSAIDYDALAKF